MTGKERMKHKNVTLRFTSITGMMKNMNKLRRTLELKKNIPEPENNKGRN